MKNFFTIFKFELDNYIKSKGFIVPTLLIAILVSIVMFAPRIKKEVFGDSKSKSGMEKEVETEEDVKKIAIYDVNKITAEEDLKEFFGNRKIVYCDSLDDLKTKVETEAVECGYEVKSFTEFSYYIYNRSITDSGEANFVEYMNLLVRKEYCAKNNLDYTEFMQVNYPNISSSTEILGKDSASGYWYCYILVMVVYMMFILYGVQTASSVTNEKSNRSIEIIITSTSSVALLFGKVLASVVAAVGQIGVILASALGSYNLNKEYWPEMISAVLDIPSEVLIAFAVFGIGGFVFYMLAYGAFGALVSKIEDLNKSIGSLQMIVVAVFMGTLASMTKADGIILKILSFVPFSSYSAMFARVAMGKVAMWEIVISAVILYASVILMGFIGARIFRASTLRYGNPINIKNALKLIKKNDN